MTAEMKILLVADIHYNLRQWDWLIDAMDRFDIVAIAGDLLDIGSMVPPAVQVVVVKKYLSRLAERATLLVCSGNHDIVSPKIGSEPDAGWLQTCRRETLHVDGDTFEKLDHFFSILPWWETPAAAAEVEELLVRHEKQRAGRPWIWIYHPPPLGTSTAWNGHDDLGDSRHCKWIERFRPTMTLGGHIHLAPFMKNGSWIDVINGCFTFNSGRQPGPRPTFTIIDTDQMHAMWIANEDAQQAELREPLICNPIDEKHPPPAV